MWETRLYWIGQKTDHWRQHYDAQIAKFGTGQVYWQPEDAFCLDGINSYYETAVSLKRRGRELAPLNCLQRLYDLSPIGDSINTSAKEFSPDILPAVWVTPRRYIDAATWLLGALKSERPECVALFDDRWLRWHWMAPLARWRLGREDLEDVAAQYEKAIYMAEWASVEGAELITFDTDPEVWYYDFADAWFDGRVHSPD